MNGTFPLLATVQKHLAARYEAEFGQELRDGLDSSVGQPAWRLLTAADFARPRHRHQTHKLGSSLTLNLGLGCVHRVCHEKDALAGAGPAALSMQRARR